MLVVVCSLFARWNITGAGARASGIGGAFIGVADDATAVVWNPAGLTQLYRAEASAVSKYNYTKSELNNWDNDKSNFILEFASVAFPFMNGKLVTALAYQRPIDLYTDFKTSSETQKDVGGADTFTLGLAYRILPFFSAGLSTNLWFGKLDHDYNYEVFDYSYVWDEWYNYEETYEYEQTFSGFNMMFGGMVDLNNLDSPIPLKLGVTYRTAFDLEAEEEGLITEETVWELGDYFYNEYETDGKVKNEMPMMLGFGTSYRIGDNLTLAFDYETRAYGKSNINSHEKDLNQFRVGVEYLFVTDLAVIPLRTGYQSVPTLMSDINGDPINGTGISFGTGLIFERFSLETAYTMIANENDRGSSGIQKNSYMNFIFSGIFYF
ncbi:MAG: hypothetical protein DRI23_04255 [Candidatus Cloacimonadota bacterium]|nr:MAG: hypothetical protein DRI23_04255 [Candidatus Cloacimonadota bacterium]RLC53734.1 MAG: hypothetical protein DRH79_02810 [Candidatus Cloacimonadota bacterium]